MSCAGKDKFICLGIFTPNLFLFDKGREGTGERMCM